MREIYHCLQIQAPPDVVFEAISSQNGLANWWTPTLEYKGDIGAIASFYFQSGAFNRMKLVQISPRVVEWLCTDGHEEWKGTQILFEMEGITSETNLRFSHFGFKEQTDYVGTCSFLWAQYLGSLKQLCESGTGRPDAGKCSE